MADTQTFIHQWDGTCTWPDGECAICAEMLTTEDIDLIRADDPRGWNALHEATLRLMSVG